MDVKAEFVDRTTDKLPFCRQNAKNAKKLSGKKCLYFSRYQFPIFGFFWTKNSWLMKINPFLVLVSIFLFLAIYYMQILSTIYIEKGEEIRIRSFGEKGKKLGILASQDIDHCHNN